MLVANELRVALATTHLPLREVADRITSDRLRDVLRILIADLQSRFAITDPEIIVCGLNPHAGEGGHLGEVVHRGAESSVRMGTLEDGKGNKIEFTFEVDEGPRP